MVQSIQLWKGLKRPKHALVFTEERTVYTEDTQASEWKEIHKIRNRWSLESAVHNTEHKIAVVATKRLWGQTETTHKNCSSQLERQIRDTWTQIQLIKWPALRFLWIFRKQTSWSRQHRLEESCFKTGCFHTLSIWAWLDRALRNLV